MDGLVKFLILQSVFIIICKAGVLPDGGRTTDIRGPSSQTKIIGPDGSVIEAEAPGGQIMHQESPGVFESAGRYLGPASPLLNPAVPGQVAHRAVNTALLGSAGPMGTGTYVAQTAQDGTKSFMGNFKTPMSDSTVVGIERQ